MRHLAAWTSLAVASLMMPGVKAQDYQCPTQFFSEDTNFAARVNLRAITGQSIVDSINAVVDLAAMQQHMSPEGQANAQQRHNQLLAGAQAMAAIPQGLAMMGVPHVSFFAMRPSADGTQGPRTYAMVPIPAGIDPATIQSSLTMFTPQMPQTAVVNQFVDDNRIDQWLVAAGPGMALPVDTGWSPARQDRFGDAVNILGADQALLWVFIPDFHLNDQAMALINAAGSQGGDMSGRAMALRVEARTIVDALTRAHWVCGTARLGSNLNISTRAELSDASHAGQLRNSWTACTTIMREAARDEDQERARQDRPPLTFTNEQIAEAVIAALQPQFGESSVRVDLTGAELRRLLTMFAVSLGEGLGEVIGDAVNPFGGFTGGQQSP